MEYFVDKIYLYDDKLVATFFYSEDRTEISWGELGDLVIDPFVKGEAAEFDVFPFGSISEWKKLKNAVNRRFTAFFLSANLKGQDRYRYLFNFNIQCFQQTNDIGK